MPAAVERIGEPLFQKCITDRGSQFVGSFDDVNYTVVLTEDLKTELQDVVVYGVFDLVDGVGKFRTDLHLNPFAQ